MTWVSFYPTRKLSF